MSKGKWKIPYNDRPDERKCRGYHWNKKTKTRDWGCKTEWTFWMSKHDPENEFKENIWICLSCGVRTKSENKPTKHCGSETIRTDRVVRRNDEHTGDSEFGDTECIEESFKSVA